VTTSLSLSDQLSGITSNFLDARNRRVKGREVRQEVHDKHQDD
jgi:hypothetical protein